MCVVSTISDDWTRKQFPNILPWHPNGPIVIPQVYEELKALKEEVENLKKELKKARLEDIESGAPMCPHKESVDLIKELAEKLGVDLEDIFDGHEKS